MTEPLPHAAMLHVSTDAPLATALTPEGLSALTSQTIAAVLRERLEQVERHGYDQHYDLLHDEAEIGRGALAYLIAGLIEEGMDPPAADLTALDVWPWASDRFRPTDYHGCLIKVAAMCIAEADRVMIARALIDGVTA